MNKLSLLLKSDQLFFHTQDLALLWSIQNRHTLRMTISRYIKRGILHSVVRGLYSTIPAKEIDKFKLGAALIHKFCYLSLESVLEKYGVINQKVYSINYVSSSSKKIELDNNLFVYRQMNPQFLLNPEGMSFEDGVYKASLERAVADSEYFKLNVFFDSPDLINWTRVSEIKKIVGY